MRLLTLIAFILSLTAAAAAIAGFPATALAVGAPSDNYTAPDIPTDNTTPDEIKPAVNFLPEGPSVQREDAPIGVVVSFASLPERDNNRITANDKWFLSVDINAPGWLYIYEYYPKGSSPPGKWVAYKWHLKESGVWKLGPFAATGDEQEGQHLYRMWFYSGGKWTGDGAPSQMGNDIAWTYSRDIPVFKIISFDINPPDINAGEPTLLSWEVQGASSVSISGEGTMAGQKGTVMIKPAATTVYVLTARDTGGQTLSQSSTVTVRPVPFAAQVVKLLGNPVVLIVLLAAIAIIIMVFVLVRRRQAARIEADDPLLLPALHIPEKTVEFRPQVVAKAVLELPDGPDIKIAGVSTTVGRADLTRNLDVDTLGFISRKQFRISLRDEQYFIEDLGGHGGTGLNGTDIRGKGEVRLKDDDLITAAGAVKLRFHIL